MSQFIRCPSCGFCIGEYAEAVDIAKQVLYQKEVFGEGAKFQGFDPDKLMFKPGACPTLEKIFDELGIVNMCCRMRLVTCINLDKTYK